MRKLKFKPKRYGIDLDGVCFDFINAFRRHLNSSLHKHLEEEEITSYYWYETTDITKEQFMEEFDRFGDDLNGYRNLEILPGTKEALEAIVSAGHEIFYITNRPLYAESATIEALEEHKFPFRQNLTFAQGKKSPVINEKNVDVFIDDSPRTIEDVTVNTRADIYCRSYKFNEHLDDTFFTRVTSWEEFLEREGLSVPAVQ